MTDRDEYVEKAKARLDQWNAEIEKLQAKAKEARADAEIEYDKQIAEMRTRRDEAEQRLKELREAGDHAWKDVKEGLDRAWDSLSESFEKARRHFK